MWFNYQNDPTFQATVSPHSSRTRVLGILLDAESEYLADGMACLFVKIQISRPTRSRDNAKAVNLGPNSRRIRE